MKQLIRFGHWSAAVFALVSPLAAHAQSIAPVTTAPVFVDDFSGASLDRGSWRIYDDSRELHRTQYGLEPRLGRDSDGTTYMRVAQQTFNPNPLWSGKKTAGAEVISQQTWSLGTGKEFEARMRMDNLTPGVVLGFFTYFADGEYPTTYRQSEIDFEFLSNLGGDKLWTNIFDDFNLQRSVDKGGGPFDAPGFNWNDGAWHTYKIRWMPTETLWIIDDRIVLRREVNILPGSAMAVRFNSWTPNPDWKEAYNSAVNPVASASENREIAYDVDYIKVRPVPNSGAPFGDGQGLKASYFNDANLSNKALERVDARINFDWGAYSPDPRIPADNFSVRWEGSIQSRYSESTTLTLQADDGVRMYLDNKLVLDAFGARGLNSHSVNWNARAGEKVAFRVEFVEAGGAAECRLNWSSASQPLSLVPQSQLYTATVAPTPTPIPTTTPAPTNLAAPTFSPPAGTYTSEQSVAIFTSAKNASIRYTLDGSLPTLNSRSLKSGGKIKIASSTLVRAIAVGKVGKINAQSGVSDANYTINIDTSLAAPTFSLAPGTYTGTQTTTISTLARGASIRYTLDGTIPTLNSRKLNNGGTLKLAASTLVRAIAVGKVGKFNAQSDVSQANYTFVTDVTPPSVSVETPGNSSVLSAFAFVDGLAADVAINGLPGTIARVEVRLTRFDGAAWNGKSWSQRPTALKTSLAPQGNGVRWTLAAKLPTGKNLSNGTYLVTATAFDGAGNVASAMSGASIAVSDAPSAGSS